MNFELPKNFMINLDESYPSRWLISTKVHELLEKGEPAYVISLQEVDTSVSKVIERIKEKLQLKLILSTKSFESEKDDYTLDEIYQGDNILFEFRFSSPCEYDAKDYKGTITILGVTQNPQMENTIQDIFVELRTKTEEKEISRCWALTQGRNSLYLEPLDLSNVEYVSGNYTDQIAIQRDHILQSFKAKRPKGRVSILTGPPGTGKTHFIEALLPDKLEKETKFVYLPAHLAAHLDTPDLLKFMLNMRGTKLIFIIEDCDSLVTPRAMDNVNTLSTFLNLTDGILGSSFDLHFIISTNEKRASFDPAITRPGRLLEVVEIGLLKPDHANEIYKRILTENGVVSTSTPFEKNATLADVYAKAHGASIYKASDKPFGLAGAV